MDIKVTDKELDYILWALQRTHAKYEREGWYPSDRENMKALHTRLEKLRRENQKEESNE